VVFAGSPVLAFTHKNLSSLKEPLRMDSIETGKRIIDEACYFGADAVLLISGEDPGPDRREEAKSRLVDSILEIEQYARTCNKGLRISLEPADRDIHRRQLLGPIGESVGVIRSLRSQSSNISLTIDMSHLAQLNENKKEALMLAKGYFNHVHIANAVIRNRNHPRFGDEHPRFGIDDGEHNEESIIQFIRELQGIDFFREDPNDQKPIISLEVKPDDTEEPKELLQESIATFLKACSAV
jgi:sugar phosphate isomerase/epimerase